MLSDGTTLHVDVLADPVDLDDALPSGTTSVGPLTIAGPLVYVVTASASGSTLRTFDRATGAPGSTLLVPSPSATTGLPRPIVANGRVFLVIDGTIHVYEPA